MSSNWTTTYIWVQWKPNRDLLFNSWVWYFEVSFKKPQIYGFSTQIISYVFNGLFKFSKTQVKIEVMCPLRMSWRNNCMNPFYDFKLNDYVYNTKVISYIFRGLFKFSKTQVKIKVMCPLRMSWRNNCMNPNKTYNSLSQSISCHNPKYYKSIKINFVLDIRNSFVSPIIELTWSTWL